MEQPDMLHYVLSQIIHLSLWIYLTSVKGVKAKASTTA